MFFAIDKNENRIHASNENAPADLYCPVCGEPVRHRKGNNRRWHFSHLPDSNCNYGEDKDYNHAWHIRMQEYFPIENREYRFVDKATGEVHIADVFIPESNIVLEFQHSKISEDEFLSRTNFHKTEGRRIVWLFDESESTPNEDHFGRFKKVAMDKSFARASGPNPYSFNFEGNPYQNLYYKWLRNPRQCLDRISVLEEYFDQIIICVYTGVEGDCFHRLQHKYSDGFETFVTFSLHDIHMNWQMDVEEFFTSEYRWQQQSPYASTFESFYISVHQLQLKMQQNVPSWRRNYYPKRTFRF